MKQRAHTPSRIALLDRVTFHHIHLGKMRGIVTRLFSYSVGVDVDGVEWRVPKENIELERNSK